MDAESVGVHVEARPGAELIVSGREKDLSPEIAALLDALRPAVHVQYVPLHWLLAAPSDTRPVENAEGIIVGLTRLDPASSEWLRRVVAHTRMPLIVVLDADTSERSVMRERVLEFGAIDCLLRKELSTPLLESALAHVRSVNREAQRMIELRQQFSVALRQRERALREQSRHDALTKLPDRRVFLERCARAVELGRAHADYVFVVLVVAVDRLGQTRDSYGIDAADQLFALVAKRVRGCLRPEDQLFRFSSSKFAILLEDVEDPDFGTQVAKRIHEAVADPFEFDEISTFTTVSIGMTSSAHGYSRVEDVVTDVGAATDSAREHGSNRHEIYDTSMRIESRTLLSLEMAMRRAIDDAQFELHFQPIVRVDRLSSLNGVTPKALRGFEALLRWQHPERGLVSPAEFIPIAEDTGLIVPIGRWVIREAVRSLQAWHEEFGHRELVVSVNLSPKQVGDPLLLETIDAVLAETGLPPTCLKLELTESVMLDRIDEVTALLQEIRGRGIQIWIDDFGTGYSSLGYLHRFPVDGLKIDRAFVSRLDGTPGSQTMVRTILDLASNFGLDVVAEGIESAVQAQHLRELGCLSCQGWLFGKPQPPALVRALLG